MKASPRCRRVSTVSARCRLAAVAALASLFGLVSFELFGHTTGVITDNDAYFALQIDALAAGLGL